MPKKFSKVDVLQRLQQLEQARNELEAMLLDVYGGSVITHDDVVEGIAGFTREMLSILANHYLPPKRFGKWRKSSHG
jgi:hypothetical protein